MTLADPTDRKALSDLARLAELFDSAAMAEPYGEELSIRHHMLQCAELAVAQRQGDVMVAAVLLHDLGWALNGADAASEHPHAAADFLAPLFGTEIADLIRNHVAAKRYLVATEPGYAASLSDESRRTLVWQGGAMPAAIRAQFAAQPYFAAALQLRYLDDAGKDARVPTTCFATYAPLLYRLLVRQRLSE